MRKEGEQMHRRRTVSPLRLIAVVTSCLVIGVTAILLLRAPGSSESPTEGLPPDDADLVAELPAVSVPRTQASGVQLQREFFDALGPRLLEASTGELDEPVSLVLATGEEDLAAALKDRFGESISVSIGGFGVGDAGDGCREMHDAGNVPAGLDFESAIPAPQQTDLPADLVLFTLEVVNRSTELISLELAEPAIGFVLSGDGAVLTDGRPLNDSGADRRLELDPGQADRVRAVASRAMCSEPGERLPSGSYEIAFELELLSGEVVVTRPFQVALD